MSDFIKTLLSTGLTLGLSDRETFVQNVSEILQRYQDDPQTRDKWAKAITDYLAQVKDNINTTNSIKSAISDSGIASTQQVSQLTEAIEELTVELRRFKDKKQG